VLSVVWNTLLGHLLARAPLLRLELHPADADHPAVRRCWMRILGRALREQHRKPLRLDEVASRLRTRHRRPGTPNAVAAT